MGKVYSIKVDIDISQMCKMSVQMYDQMEKNIGFHKINKSVTLWDHNYGI